MEAERRGLLRGCALGGAAVCAVLGLPLTWFGGWFWSVSKETLENAERNADPYGFVVGMLLAPGTLLLVAGVVLLGLAALGAVVFWWSGRRARRRPAVEDPFP